MPVLATHTIRKARQAKVEAKKGRKRMIRLIAIAAFALAVATSAQAMSPAPLQQPDGMTTQVAYGCGPGRTRVAGVCVARTPSDKIPIASDALPRATSRCFLVWGFFCQGVRQSGKYVVLVSFFVRSQSPFLRPDPQFADVVARRSCQGWPPRQPCGMLRACQAIP